MTESKLTLQTRQMVGFAGCKCVLRNIHGYPASMETWGDAFSPLEFYKDNASMPVHSSQDQGPPCFSYGSFVIESFHPYEVNNFGHLIHVDMHSGVVVLTRNVA